MKRLTQCAVMVLLLAGFQGMAVDVTCLVFWHSDDTALSQQDLAEVFGHHPDSSAAHQTSSDGEALLDVGTSVDQAISVSASDLLPEPQGLTVPLMQPQLTFLTTHSWNISNPPEHVVFI